MAIKETLVSTSYLSLWKSLDGNFLLTGNKNSSEITTGSCECEGVLDI